ncbi:hypothetical protein [Gilvimarinus japonicus]|uniref:Uncharacterized protein n=1 Tax=Gilvimarinus japonicus TaxID=1796469 RepID=A0ABV7HSV0_9GAMM
MLKLGNGASGCATTPGVISQALLPDACATGATLELDLTDDPAPVFGVLDERLAIGVLVTLLLDGAEGSLALGVDDDAITELLELALERAGALLLDVSAILALEEAGTLLRELLELLPMLAVEELASCAVELLMLAAGLGVSILSPSDEPPQALRVRVHIPVIINRRIMSLRPAYFHLVALSIWFEIIGDAVNPIF